MNTIKLFYKKGPKFVSFLISILLIANLTTTGYFIYSLYQYKSITLLNNIVIGLIVVAFIVNIIFLLLGASLTLKRKWFMVSLFVIFMLGLSSGTYYVTDKFVNAIYKKLGGISEKSATYTSQIVVLNNSGIDNEKDLVDQSIGVIESSSNINQSQNSNDIITELNINETDIKEYEDYISLIKDLLDKKIDAAILPGGFAGIYGETAGLEKITTDVKVIYSKNFEVKTRSNKKNKITEPFSLLIMGIDGTGDNIDKANSLNGDALMLITYNPKTLNTTMLSIPRDSYVPIMCMKNERKNKITHAGIGGEECMIKTVENFTGIKIDYYVKINFSGVVKLVDDLGGVDVNVPIKFCEQDSKRRLGKYTICLKPGQQQLTGEQALALSRHRKTINDFERGYNQQLVVNAMVNKTKSIRNLNTLLNMLDTVSSSMKTNMTTNQIMSLFDNLQKNIGKEKFSSQKLYLSGYDKMIFDPVFNATLYNFVLYDDSVKESVNAMKVNLELRKPTIIKKFSFNANEPYVSPEIGKGKYKASITSTVLLPNFVNSDKSYVQNWCDSHNIKVIFNDKTTEIKSEDNKVLTQSAKSGTDISDIRTLTISIGSYKEPVVAEETTTEEPNNSNTSSTNEETTTLS